jgi:hypothetical protein
MAGADEFFSSANLSRILNISETVTILSPRRRSLADFLSTDYIKLTLSGFLST